MCLGNDKNAPQSHMNFLKVTSPKQFAIQLVIILGLGLILTLSFFYVYLPVVTNHDETVTVPDLEGINISNIDEFLTKRNLKYEVMADSGFTSSYEPQTILKQYPLPGSKVKENRKVFLTLNAVNPPTVKMPDLVDGSVKNAQLLLESYGLERGQIKYVPDLAQNAVLEQNFEGKAIEAGAYLPKGSKIDLVVGDGLGNTLLEVPDLTGMELEEAEFTVVGSGLKMGNVLFKDPKLADRDPKSEKQQADERLVIVRQSPASGKNVHIGEEVDVWLDKQQGTQESILDDAEEAASEDK